MSDAPLFTEVAGGPPGGRAVWLRTSDGVRLRAGLWQGGDQGTVLLLPGRTEYIEKYAGAAGDLAARGYTTLSIDWRGQGLADRALPDRMTGHVLDFSEYQKDLDAVFKLAHELDLPRPFYLLSHSMGGCIGLRGLINGLPVQAAMFSAPMWGIKIAPALRPLAVVLARTSRWFAQSHRYTPGTGPTTYVLEADFAGNVLTTDKDMYDLMKRQVSAHPDLALGGPSFGWLHAALTECAALARLPSPDLPAVCALGTAEKVVEMDPIHQRMRRWSKGSLDIYPNAEHEVLMEGPATRQRFFDSAANLFRANR